MPEFPTRRRNNPAAMVWKRVRGSLLRRGPQEKNASATRTRGSASSFGAREGKSYGRSRRPHGTRFMVNVCVAVGLPNWPPRFLPTTSDRCFRRRQHTSDAGSRGLLVNKHLSVLELQPRADHTELVDHLFVYRPATSRNKALKSRWRSLERLFRPHWAINNRSAQDER